MSDKAQLPIKAFYRLDEIAEYFSVHPRTVRNWIECGLFRAVRIRGTIRIPRDGNPILTSPVTALLNSDGSFQIKIL